MTEKLDPQLDQAKIKQTGTTIDPIRFRDEAINKVKKQNINFNKKPYIFIPFIVSKDSHQKGLKLRVYKGSVKEKETKKVFPLFRRDYIFYKGMQLLYANYWC